MANGRASCFSWPSYIIQDAWAAMLEDEKWLTAFLSRNQELLAEQYGVAAKFLKDRGVAFYEKTCVSIQSSTLRYVDEDIVS